MEASSSSASSSSSSSSSSMETREKFPKVVPTPYQIHYEEETTGMSKSKHHYRWKFAFYDNQNEVNTFVRHFIYFSHSALSGKRVIRENDKEVYCNKQTHFSSSFVHEWFSIDTGILYKIEGGGSGEGHIFYVNNIPYQNFRQDLSSLNSFLPGGHDHDPTGTSDGIREQYDLRYLTMGSGSNSVNGGDNSSSNRRVYHGEVDSLFTDLEEGSPLLASASALAVRDSIYGRTPSTGPYEDSLRSTLTYSSIGGRQRDYMGRYADEMESDAPKWRRYFMYLVVVATSLFVVNVASRKYPMMGIGRSTMMQEENSPDSVAPAATHHGEATAPGVCNVHLKPTCSETAITISVPPDEIGRWPQGLTWAVSKEGAGDLSPVNELRAIQNAEYVMNEKMYFMNSNSNQTCPNYVTTLCLDGDYVLSVTSAVPGQHRVVQVCHQEVPIAEQLGFNTQQPSCSNGFVAPPDPTVIRENTTNSNTTNSEECIWGWLCPPTEWGNAIPVPTYAPTLVPTAAPNADISVWKPTKNCEFLGFFCHDEDTPEPTYAPSRFPTPGPVYFTGMPIAPLVEPTLSPMMEFHLPPWLGGPPEVDDDTAAQATNNSTDGDSSAFAPVKNNTSEPIQSPSQPSNRTVSSEPSHQPLSPDQSHNATRPTKNISRFKDTYGDGDEDNEHKKRHEYESRDALKHEVGAMLEAIVKKGPSMSRVEYLDPEESSAKDDLPVKVGSSKDAHTTESPLARQVHVEEEKFLQEKKSPADEDKSAIYTRETDPEWLKAHPSFTVEKAKSENDKDMRHQDLEWLRSHPSYFEEEASDNQKKLEIERQKVIIF